MEDDTKLGNYGMATNTVGAMAKFTYGHKNILPTSGSRMQFHFYVQIQINLTGNIIGK